MPFNFLAAAGVRYTSGHLTFTARVWTVKQIARQSLVDTAASQMMEEIRSGSWPVHSRIPAEPELSRVLSVSRPTVREAVRALAQLGLLETRQGDGTYVTADDPAPVALRRAILGADPSEVITVRRALDALAAQEAAEHCTEDDLSRLDDLLARREQAITDRDSAAFTEHDADFHIAVAAASGNRFLSAVYASFDVTLIESVGDKCAVSAGKDPDERGSHRKLLQAIRDRNPANATAIALGILADQEYRLGDDAAQ